MVNRSTDYVASTRLMPITKDDQSSETLKPIYSKFQCRICNCNRCHQTVYHLTMYTVQLLAQNQQNLLMLLVRRGQICVSRTLIIGLCLILSLDIVDFSITMVGGVVICIVEIGDVEIGDVEIGDVAIGDVEIGDVAIGGVEIGGVERHR